VSSMKPVTFSAKILAVLVHARRPLTIAEIAKQAGASVTTVKVNLHRLDKMGGLVKYPKTYAMKKGAQP
jgi:DNA-binding transcriptional regulator GbsR (MarR family)